MVYSCYIFQQLTVEGRKGTVLHVRATAWGFTKSSTDDYLKVNLLNFVKKVDKNSKTSLKMNTSSSLA
jgi:hypothetical protein